MHFAAEDPLYEKHFPQLVYFCDQNGVVRHILLTDNFSVHDGEDNTAPLPTGESMSESLKLYTN